MQSYLFAIVLSWGSYSRQLLGERKTSHLDGLHGRLGRATAGAEKMIRGYYWSTENG
jgi:hypothetical protein